MIKHFSWAIALILLLFLILGVQQTQAAGEPYPGTVSRAVTLEFYPATALTGSGAITSDSPRTINSQDITLVSVWHSADVFATVDITPTGTVTITPLLSADGQHWAAATFVTTSWLTDGTSLVNRHAHQLVFTADGTQYLRLPIAGERMKFQIEHSDAVTPSISVTLRND